MSSPAVQVCSIIIHPPPLSPDPATPPAHYRTLDSLAQARGTRLSPAVLKGGTLAPAFPTITLPTNQGLGLPLSRMQLIARKIKASRKVPRSARGRRLPDPWKVVWDPGSEQFMLVPVQHPGDAPSNAVCGAATGSSQAPATTSSSSPPQPVPPLAPGLLHYDHARLIPFYETAFYLVILYFYVRCTLMTLFC
ncbi:hypothetical protein BD414DRAFT_475065 [Trametes punicea]|nr:hypothetical protein BD414DRAFT_475065 [Trametes punicea]